MLNSVKFMMFDNIQILCMCIVAVTITLAKSNQEDDKGIGGPVNYEFGYNVYDPTSEDIKSHHEIREGKNVYGFYTFKEADGSIRVVKYKVGPTTGFEATVEKLKPGQRIALGKADHSQDPESGQATKNVEETVPNAIDDYVVPQYVGGGSRSQYVLGIINNPLQDILVKNGGHEQQRQQHADGQRYQQAPTVQPAYRQRQENVYDGRHRNQYVAPASVRGNSGYSHGQKQVHAHRQGYRQPIRALAPVHNNQYPTQLPRAQDYARPVHVSRGTRRNQGNVNAQEQTQVQDVTNNAQLQNLQYAPDDGGQVVNQEYAVSEEAEGQETVEEEDNNAEVKDEGEQEAEDNDEYEDEFKADLEFEDDDEQADEEQAEHLEEEEGEDEYVEEATEAQQKESA